MNLAHSRRPSWDPVRKGKRQPALHQHWQAGVQLAPSPIFDSKAKNDDSILTSLGLDNAPSTSTSSLQESPDMEEGSIEEQIAKMLAARSLDRVIRRTPPDADQSGPAMMKRMTERPGEVVEEFEGKATELYHGAEESIYGIVREFYHLTSTSPHRSESPITIFNADRKLRRQASPPKPITDCEEYPSQESSERQKPPQDVDVKQLEKRRAQLLAELQESMSLSLRRAVKEFEEKASRPYDSRGLVNRAKGTEERATGFLNRAEEGISGLMKRRHMDERADQRQPGLALAHIHGEGDGSRESILSNVQSLSGVMSSVRNRASDLRSAAGDTVTGIMQSHTDYGPREVGKVGLRSSPAANHQDETKSVQSSPESVAQEITLFPLCSSHIPYQNTNTTGNMERGRDIRQEQEQTPGVQLVVTNASDEGVGEGDANGQRGTHDSGGVFSGTSGLAHVPPGVQTEYYKDAEVAGIKETTSSREEVGGKGTSVSSHIIHGVGGVGFTMDTEGGRLPGYPTPAGMSQLIRDRMQADIRRKDAQASTEEGGGLLKPSCLPVPTHLELNASTEAVKGSPAVQSSAAMGLNPRDLGPPITTSVDAKPKGIN